MNSDASRTCRQSAPAPPPPLHLAPLDPEAFDGGGLLGLAGDLATAQQHCRYCFDTFSTIVSVPFVSPQYQRRLSDGLTDETDVAVFAAAVVCRVS